MSYRDSCPDHEKNEKYLEEQQKKAKKTLFIVIGVVIAFPVLLLGVGFAALTQKEKPEYESLEATIRSVGTKILEKDDCDENVQGYYAWKKLDGKVMNDEVVICTNNFDKTWDGYPQLLKHEMTHIMQACLGTTINSPDEIRELRSQLKEQDEDSYRTIHGAYGEHNHFHEVEARWMESQDFVYVNRELKKYCG